MIELDTKNKFQHRKEKKQNKESPYFDPFSKKYFMTQFVRFDKLRRKKISSFKPPSIVCPKPQKSLDHASSIGLY